MRTALNVAAKDLRLLFRDPQTTAIQILMPLILAIVIGYAMEGVLSGEGRLRVAAIDLDQTVQSAAFVDALNDGDAIALKKQNWSQAGFTEHDAAAMLDDGKRLAVLVIPKGFGASATGGPRTVVRLYTDPAQRQFVRSVTAIVSGELQRGTLTAAIVSVGAEAGLAPQQAIDRLSGALADPQVSLHDQPLVKGTSLPSGFDQTIPGFTVMFAMFMSAFVVISVYRERVEYGTWGRVLLSPTSRLVLLGGRLLSAYALGVVQMIILFGVGRIAFGIELGNLPGLIVAIAVFLLVPVALGLFLSTFYGSLVFMISLSNVLVIVLGAIGGSLVPIFMLPRWMEVLASFTPHYWALQGLQDMMFRGASVSDIWQNLGILLAFAGVLFAAGLARFSYAK